MLTRKQIKHLRGLRKKAYRYEHRQFLVEGETIVREVLSAQCPAFRMLVCTQAYFSSLTLETATRYREQIIVCDEKTLQSISSLDHTSPVLALLDMPTAADESKPVTGLALYMDGIRDPGNLGAILRVADWFGISAVYLADDCVDVFNPKTVQASMGAFLRVPCLIRSLQSIRHQQSRLPILGTCVSGGADPFQHAWQSDSLLVIGSESRGIRQENIPFIATWLSIARGPTRSGAESLNAAVATGILCAASRAT